jgi:nitroimidazol reductase NimA-like FMN-containing flavoprotein (pyridoxamine 5'-phosphate oxidase superfamily)
MTAGKYHMNRADREIAGRDELLELLKAGKYTTLALCRGEEPYVVTLSYGYDHERNALYFHTAAKGLKLDFIAANPQACGTVIHDDGYVRDQCMHYFRSIVFRGTMAMVDDPAEKLHAMEVLADHLEADPEKRKAKLRRMDDEAWKGLAVLRLDIAGMDGKKYG